MLSVTLADALEATTALVKELAARSPSRPVGAFADRESSAVQRTLAGLSESALWDRVATFLRPGDIVLADQGCSFYGRPLAACLRMSSSLANLFGHRSVTRCLRYSAPAWPTRGAGGFLLIGDGAGQMTVQELSTLFREGLSFVIIVVDNGGYTVERAIHGAEQSYNDIAQWDWTSSTGDILPAFSVHSCRTRKWTPGARAFGAAPIWDAMNSAGTVRLNRVDERRRCA